MREKLHALLSLDIDITKDIDISLCSEIVRRYVTHLLDAHSVDAHSVDAHSAEATILMFLANDTRTADYVSSIFIGDILEHLRARPPAARSRGGPGISETEDIIN
jgi:hypothetical protein